MDTITLDSILAMTNGNFEIGQFLLIVFLLIVGTGFFKTILKAIK